MCDFSESQSIFNFHHFDPLVHHQFYFDATVMSQQSEPIYQLLTLPDEPPAVPDNLAMMELDEGKTSSDDQSSLTDPLDGTAEEEAESFTASVELLIQVKETHSTTRSPVITSFILASLLGEGVSLRENTPQRIKFNVWDVEQIFSFANRLQLKISPTKDIAARQKGMRQWLSDFPASHALERDGPVDCVLTPLGDYDKFYRMRALIEYERLTLRKCQERLDATTTKTTPTTTPQAIVQTQMDNERIAEALLTQVNHTLASFVMASLLGRGVRLAMNTKKKIVFAVWDLEEAFRVTEQHCAPLHKIRRRSVLLHWFPNMPTFQWALPPSNGSLKISFCSLEKSHEAGKFGRLRRLITEQSDLLDRIKRGETQTARQGSEICLPL